MVHCGPQAARASSAKNTASRRGLDAAALRHNHDPSAHVKHTSRRLCHHRNASFTSNQLAAAAKHLCKRWGNTHLLLPSPVVFGRGADLPPPHRIGPSARVCPCIESPRVSVSVLRVPTGGPTNADVQGHTMAAARRLMSASSGLMGRICTPSPEIRRFVAPPCIICSAGGPPCGLSR